MMLAGFKTFLFLALVFVALIFLFVFQDDNYRH